MIPSETSSTDRGTELAARLRVVLTRTARRLRQEADSGLSPSLTSALVAIGRHGPLTPSELAEQERVKRPTATRMIARLEEQELVTRSPDAADKRSHTVAITPAGTELLAVARLRKTVYLGQWLEALGEGDLATLEAAASLFEQLLDERR